MQNARNIREDTAELATYLLSDGQVQLSPAFLQRARSSFHEAGDSESGDDAFTADHARNSETILEVSEPPSPETERNCDAPAGPSVLANLLKGSPAQLMAQQEPTSPGYDEDAQDDQDDQGETEPCRASHHADAASERTPLLSRVTSDGRQSYTEDLEGQKSHSKHPWISGLVGVSHKMEERMTHGVAVAVNPRRWDYKAIWQNTVLLPASCLPAVAVGLLLNILDALSYGSLSGSYTFLIFTDAA